MPTRDEVFRDAAPLIRDLILQDQDRERAEREANAESTAVAS